MTSKKHLDFEPLFVNVMYAWSMSVFTVYDRDAYLNKFPHNLKYNLNLNNKFPVLCVKNVEYVYCFKKKNLMI